MSKAAYGIFIFILIFSPLAFGTVEQWSITIMEGSSLLALSLLLLDKLRSKSQFFYRVPGLLPLTVFLSYMLFQAIPLPPILLEILSSETYALYKDTIWLNGEFTWSALTLNKKSTISEFFRILSYASFYVLTVQLLANRKYLKTTISIVIIFASILSFLSILQAYSSNNEIFWMRSVPDTGAPFGPYVNPNHYAGFMGMIFPLILCIFFFYKPEPGTLSFRQKMSAFINNQKLTPYILLGFVVLLTAVSIFLTRSKGGILSLSLSLGVFAVMIMRRTEKNKRGSLIILMVILIVLSVGWFGWQPIMENFERIGSINEMMSVPRVDIWKDSINIIKDFPLIGTGFGTYIDIYPTYRSLQEAGIVDHAHNDYLEILTDGGGIAGLLICWFLVIVLYGSYRVFIQRREAYSIYVYIGAVTGIIFILMHSFTDFNLHIGANGLYFFFLSGLAVSAAHTRFRDSIEETALQRRNLFRVKPLNIIVLILLIVSLTYNIGVILGKFSFSSIGDKNLELENEETLARIKNVASMASMFDPLEARYHYFIANVESLLLNKRIALNHYKKAVRLDPTDGEYLQALGLVMSQFKKDDIADTLLRKGTEFERRNPARFQLYASWLMSHNKVEEGIKYMKKAIALDHGNTGVYITTMVLNGLDDMEIQRAIPNMFRSHILFADYLSKTGNDEMAAYEYRTAIDFIGNENILRASYFLRPYKYLSRKELHGNALDVMKKAAELFPENVKVRLNTAEAYERAGQVDSAVEEYKRVLVIDPDNKRAKKRIEKLR